MRSFLLAATAALLLPATAVAQSPVPSAAAAAAASPELTSRIEQLVDVLKGSGDYDAFFAPAFRAAVPRTVFDQVTRQLVAASGAVVGIDKVAIRTPHAAVVSVKFERGVVPVAIAVDPAPPHQVTLLRAGSPVAQEASPVAVVAALRALPGVTGFALARLNDGAPQIVESHQSATPLAIGSAFKLAILAELVRATNAGERKWSDVITLDGTPLAGGGYAAAPAGTRVALRDLAERMISVSDNSATDILLFHLGRAKVEAMLDPIGWRDGRPRPFLGTLEAFKLKLGNGGALAERWKTLDESGRRVLLAKDVAAMPLTALDDTPFRQGRPTHLEVEWYASPADLVRVMDWLRRNTAANPDARAILSKNPGISASAWRFVGYKGGSEPGIMNMTLLLEGRDGSWHALTASWNNPAAAIHEGRFAALIARYAELTAPK